MKITHPNHIIVFVKYPQPGKVKTRLALHIGTQKVIKLYRAFVEDTLDKLDRGQNSVAVFFDPADKETLFKDWLGNRVYYYPQGTGDLGLKMKKAFDTLFNQKAEKIILIGTDIPQLTVEVIHEAFLLLESNEAVLGPSEDGGYYLIGFRRKTFESSVFHGIQWSVPDVFNSTMRRLDKLNRSVGLLQAFNDIDTIEDLERLKQNISNLSATCPKTCRILLDL
jgi:rSAM/selenodomain-associated transferase 1